MAISTAKGIVKECRECREILPLGDFSQKQGICKPCRRDRQQARRNGAQMCDIWLVCANGECTGSGSRVFEAVCRCGHYMAGRACERCLGAALLGCLTCWREKRHKCPVRFLEPVEVAS